jgi:hypothetical protein
MLTTAPETAVTADVIEVEWDVSFNVNDQANMDYYNDLASMKGSKMPTVLAYGHVLGGNSLTYEATGEVNYGTYTQKWSDSSAIFHSLSAAACVLMAATTMF